MSIHLSLSVTRKEKRGKTRRRLRHPFESSGEGCCFGGAAATDATADMLHLLLRGGDDHRHEDVAAADEGDSHRYVLVNQMNCHCCKIYLENLHICKGYYGLVDSES